MTEMELTYMFIRYVSVTIKRQAGAFYRRYNKLVFYENEELKENLEIEKTGEYYLNRSSIFCGNINEKLIYQELLAKGLKSLDEKEAKILCEKFLNQRSDFDIGNEYSVSSQMISKRKRKIFRKLASFFV